MHPTLSQYAQFPYVGSKVGATPLLAVATEQGTVHVLNTSRRNDWDPGSISLLIRNAPTDLLFI